VFYTLLLPVHRVFLPSNLYCWKFQENKSFSRTFYPLVFMGCGGRGMGVKKEGSLTSLRKDLASRWLSLPLCLLRMTGQFFLYWNTQHTNTHTHTHTRQPPVGEGVAFFQQVKVRTEIKSRKGSLTIKYSIPGKFTTGLPAHVNELFKSRPRADYPVFDITGWLCYLRHTEWHLNIWCLGSSILW